jgi:type IV secretion system protein VirB10
MSQYDEETGLVLSDEDEIAREAALTEDEGDTNNDEIADAPEVPHTSKVPRINKKLILLVVGSLASLIVIVSIISPSEEKKKKTNADGVASELLVPDFTVQRKPYEEQEYEPATTVQVEQPVYVQTVQPAPRAQPSGGGGSSGQINESAQNIPVSTIIPVVQGRLLGQEAVSSYRGTQVTDPMMQAVSGLSPIPLGQDEYTASRISALGGLGGTAGAGSSSGVMSYREQNMQDDKLSFYNSGRKDEATGQYIGNDTIWNGSIIPGVLITGINTDLPGDVQARVTENIYDSLTGKKLLIPQGSILIASYNSSISFAQERVQIAWNTLIRPDGYQVSLGNMNGVDAQGYSGTKGKVDEHLFQYVKAMGIISAFTLVNGEFAATMKATQNETAQNLIAANQNVVNQLGAKIIDRTMNIQPTLTVKSGTRINIMLNKNIRLPPMESPPVTSAYKR